MTEIVVSEFMEQAAVARLCVEFDVLYEPKLVDTPEQLRRSVGTASALIVRNRTAVDADLLAAAPRLEVVGRLGVGVDNIDLETCKQRNIGVLPATGANATAVAEYVIAGALMLLRGAYFASAAVAGGQWPRERLLGREVTGKTIGLVGFGTISREVARRAGALGMEATAYDPYVDPADTAWRSLGVTQSSLDELIARADIVSLHVPLNAETRNLIDAKRFAAMKANAALINSGRGGLVDESALAAALYDGQIGAAMLDVFATEPLASNSVLAGVPNLIMTPHIAGITVESNRRVSDVTVENVIQYLRARR
ncbi:MAG: hydroxyacid dehydrogenase [Gammaproteobacteria bacterium]|nr:hydroxyacid dehydrogenase [Gammaproteobacteria bacterium]MDH3469518.1 hydroxyacid dehydrogenase [Gammaproteobacteria bacterium]